MVLGKSLNGVVLAPPIYAVFLDILRPDSQSCISASPQGYGQCWGKCFSAFLVLSSLRPMVSQSNEPFLHGTEARIEVHSGWNSQSSYFHSRNGTLVCYGIPFLLLVVCLRFFTLRQFQFY